MSLPRKTTLITGAGRSSGKGRSAIAALDSASRACNFGGDFALMSVLRKLSAELEKMLAE